MNLVNKEVVHKSFGEGVIVECTESYLVIDFPSGSKKFVYPDAFESYLTLLDKKAAANIDEIIGKIIAERKIQEDKMEKEKSIELQEQERIMKIEKMLKNHKIHISSQLAVKSEGEDVQKIFEEWRIFSGLIKSGENEGKPTKLIRLHQNSACLITHKEEGKSEKERYILGAFMVEENFVGRLNEDGYIPAHPEYRIKLTEEESKQMPFWKYYKNKRFPKNIVWNSGENRYFDNIWMLQILKDILALKNQADEQASVQNFIDYFSLLNLIDKNSTLQAEGALII